MKKRKIIAALAIAGSVSLMGAACSDTDSATTTSQVGVSATAGADTSTMTITEIVAGDPDFSTLLAAVQAADLGTTLSSDGPFTVFAPTNEAFAALPQGTLDTLLKPANKDQLAAILTYHVVAADVMAADVQPGAVTTVNSADITIATSDGGAVTITDGQGNEATVTATDVVASNGVIHVIDAVLLPPSN